MPIRIALLMGSVLMMMSTNSFGQADDVALKAAFIYNFALFTTWQGPSRTPDFRVCTTSDGELWNSLQRLRGKLVGTRQWAVYPITHAETPQQCDVLVVSGTATTPSYPATLIVRDGDLSPNDGAAIALVTEGNHVRFDIDTRAARRSGLTFSSKLLSLARSVQ
ncbi:hypothetical protein GCM10007242_17210 [Pigmentiphaga litoralis]|jgi:hypothetical protein|uniref:YfiR family protein n=1 Tax=Pigmentiphaga litoralis TaxID=516702 RepID=UPI0016792B81|nr:YfiR family protein [Pigmentiphaga litoralis]GGX11598.1 hypothetical protein GCM10007242_17210 [Pigmentiphaga litoralis]